LPDIKRHQRRERQSIIRLNNVVVGSHRDQRDTQRISVVHEIEKVYRRSERQVQRPGTVVSVWVLEFVDFGDKDQKDVGKD
jgi:hypothetical protein